MTVLLLDDMNIKKIGNQTKPNNGVQYHYDADYQYGNCRGV